MNIKLTPAQDTVLAQMDSAPDHAAPPVLADAHDLQVLAAKGLVEPFQFIAEDPRAVAYRLTDHGRGYLRGLQP